MKNKGRKKGDDLVICEMDIVLGYGKPLGRSSQMMGGVGVSLYIYIYIYISFSSLHTLILSKEA